VKVVQVCPRYYPDIGGVETHVKEISERLVKRGFDVEVICTDPSGRLKRHEIINGVSVTRFRSYAPHDAYYFAPQIYFYIKDQGFDLIHVHSYHALPALFASLAKKSRRLIFTPHYHRRGHTLIRNLLHKPYRIIGGKIFEIADKVICVSEYEKSMVILDFNIHTQKIEKIPNGLDIKEFMNLEPKKKGKDDRKTLLYVGRLEQYKGIHHIIEALKDLKEYKLDVVGKGPYENNLQKLAQELSVTERINWYKNITRKEMLNRYASADMFIMLSKYEAFGITVAEALAAGTPCIVAMGSALEEFVDGKRCIGIDKPVTNEKLIKAIIHMDVSGIKNNMETKNLPLLDWDNVTNKVIEVYNSKQ
jgi:glycosyltransferase involved in cell wall biosynthesis